MTRRFFVTTGIFRICRILYSITTYCFNTAKLRNSPVIKQKTSDIKDFFCDFLHFSLDFICFLKVNNYICSIILNIIHR
ncbi:hypothetical protein DYJ25_04315 [Prevotella denticola]|nr:hypothetical protein DYJ25_04315 [Prevotella denticola]